MPTWQHESYPIWKMLKVNFRGPDELDQFKKLINQTWVTRDTPSIWYPEEKDVIMSEWRVVEAGADPDALPHNSRAKMKKMPKPRKKAKISG
jgi:hypothetical protein